MHIAIKLAATLLAITPLSTAMAQSTDRGEPNDNQRMMESFGLEIPSDKQYEKMVKKAYKNPLGSKKNPVRTDAVAGQREYLQRLRCGDGSSPQYRRDGNVGSGVYGYIVDAYIVDCGSAAPGATTIYMDLYHGGYVEQELVKGFYFEDNLPGAQEPIDQQPTDQEPAEQEPDSQGNSPDIAPDGSPVILQQPETRNTPLKDDKLQDPIF